MCNGGQAHFLKWRHREVFLGGEGMGKMVLGGCKQSLVGVGMRGEAVEKVWSQEDKQPLTRLPAASCSIQIPKT